ncbi:MAG: tetratricopeptide repeat protein [Aquificae bacterium]|nr:tetratricopeptide repeat protein [Aquificota bacterium]
MSKKLSLLFSASLFLFSCSLVKERPPAPGVPPAENQPTNEARAREKAAEFFYKLGLAAMAEGNYAKAIANFKRATEVNPSDPVLWKSLGDAYRSAKFYQKAEEALLKAVELKPDYGEALFSLGLLYEEWGKLDEALKWYQKAAALDTFDERYAAYYRLAQVYKKLGDLKAYEKNLKRAVYLYPGYGAAVLELARYYASGGYPLLAENYYRLYLTYFPNDWRVKLEFADVLIAQGKFQEAKRLLKEVVENAQDPELLKEAYRKVNEVLVAEAQKKLNR